MLVVQGGNTGWRGVQGGGGGAQEGTFGEPGESNILMVPKIRYLGASFIPSYFRVKMFVLFFLVDRPSEHLSIRTIPIYR